MARQRGRNNGVTGLVELPGQSAKFYLSVYGFSRAMQAATKRRVGRGTGAMARLRSVLVSGQLVVSGIVRGDAYCETTTFQGEEGTITLQFDEGKTCAVPVKITSSQISHDENSEYAWRIALTCEITGQPVWAGFGVQQTPAAITYTDQELYEGKGTTYDPSGLQDGATIYVDVVGTADTDAAEVAKIAALIAAQTPAIAGLKWRVGSLVSRDPFGCVFSLQASRTSTADDVNMPATFVTVDQSGLKTAAQVSAINATPSVPAGQVARATTTKPLNDGKTQTLIETGLETTAEERAREQESDVTDSQGLKDVYHVVQHDNATPPAAASGFTLVDTKHVELPAKTHGVTGVKDEYVFQFARAGSKDRIEAAGTQVRSDAGGVSPAETLRIVAASQPDTPDPENEDLVLVGVDAEPVPDNPAMIAYTFRYGARNSAEELADDGSETVVDASDLESGAVVAVVHTSETAPSTPTSPNAGQKLVRRKSRRRGLRWVHVFFYGWETTKEELTREKTFTRLDPDSVESKAQTAALGSATPANPGGAFVKAEDETVTLKDGTLLKLSRWDNQGGGAQKIILQKTQAKYSARTYGQYSTSEAAAATPATLKTVVEAYLTAGLSDASFEAAEGEMVTPTKAIITLRYVLDDAHVDIRPFWMQEHRNINHASQVLLTQYDEVGGDWINVWVAQQLVTRHKAKITVRRRRLVASTGLGDYRTGIGSTNNAAFLGYPTGSLKYTGASISQSAAVSGVHLAMVDYELEYDSAAHYSDAGSMSGWVHLEDTAGAITGPGSYNASDLGWAISFPATADFSGILT